tara:strand:- start:7394 stop:8257 length:864 start_codon:yes stop_codon:yes gene_type:complete
MTKSISLILYKIFFYFNKILKFIFKKNFLIHFKEFLENDSYKEIAILDNQVKFFTPSVITNWRIETLFTKEPETIDWINSFEKNEEIIFWDIGANVGIYSVYNALKNKNSITYAFEPSTSNLRSLSRNISINNLQNKINIVPIPLTNITNKFLMMKETQFIEGGALNAFGVDFNYEGMKIKSNMNYRVIGTTINFLIENTVLEIPDYIKIDVDGIEHLILEGANKYLNNKKIKSILVEINEDFSEQYSSVIKTLEHSGFNLHEKKQANMFKNTDQGSSFNYIFNRDK